MMLKVDGVGHVVSDPPDEVVTAGTATTTVGSRRLIKPTGDVIPTTDMTSVRPEDDHVVGMSQQALPQLRISFEHAQVSGVDLLEKPIDVVRNRIVHLSSSPPLHISATSCNVRVCGVADEHLSVTLWYGGVIPPLATGLLLSS